MWRRLFDDLPRRSLLFDAAAVGVILALGLSAPFPKFRPSADGTLAGPRATLLRRIDRVFTPPVSHWVAGLLLGEDGGFSSKWKEVFRNTGTSHLTAVSGQNVGLVLEAFKRPMLFLPIGRKRRLAVQFGGIVFFVLLTGAPASVVRAAFMWAVIESAGVLIGRPVKRLRALLFAVLVLVIIDPPILMNDRGFQLSVLATFGLAAVAPVFADSWFDRKRWGKESWRRNLRDAICQSAAATLMTAPLIAWMTGRYSIVALLANVAVAFFIPILMAAGAVALAAGFVFPAGAAFLVTLFNWFFMTPLVILKFLAGLPLSSATGISAWTALTLSTAALLWALVRWHRKEEEKRLSYADFH